MWGSPFSCRPSEDAPPTRLSEELLMRGESTRDAEAQQGSPDVELTMALLESHAAPRLPSQEITSRGSVQPLRARENSVCSPTGTSALLLRKPRSQHRNLVPLLAAGIFVYRRTGSAPARGRRLLSVRRSAPARPLDRHGGRPLRQAPAPPRHPGRATAIAARPGGGRDVGHAARRDRDRVRVRDRPRAGVHLPTLQAILPDLVPPDRLGSAIALKALTLNLARGIGPATAALVIATAGIGRRSSSTPSRISRS